MFRRSNVELPNSADVPARMRQSFGEQKIARKPGDSVVETKLPKLAYVYMEGEGERDKDGRERRRFYGLKRFSGLDF